VSIDRGDSHWEDAGTWERACRHIALFLWWAAEHNLASEDHDPKVMAKDPTGHFIGMCDTKLWNDDFTEDGVAFAEDAYSDYLVEVEAYAQRLGVGDYEIPENATTQQHFFAWLDARFAAYRSESGNPKPKKPPPAAAVKPKRAAKAKAVAKGEAKRPKAKPRKSR
jgi:hypothetical protein